MPYISIIRFFKHKKHPYPHCYAQSVADGHPWGVLYSCNYASINLSLHILFLKKCTGVDSWQEFKLFKYNFNHRPLSLVH